MTTIADYIHSLGMGWWIKNPDDTGDSYATDMYPLADAVLTEQCNQYSSCGLLYAYVGHKAVFNAEYHVKPVEVLPLRRCARVQRSSIPGGPQRATQALPVAERAPAAWRVSDSHASPVHERRASPDNRGPHPNDITQTEQTDHRRVVLPIYLTDERSTVELADGEVVGVGFTPFLDEARTVEIKEDDRSPVLPGVVYSRVAGVSFHDDVIQLPDFTAVGSRDPA